MFMKHVNEIRNMVENGQHQAAHKALNNLLDLGPSNIEALKMKGLLFAIEGRFHDEVKMWEKVLDKDREDQDAILFFQRKYLEERESFYFTDQLPAGGRRFLAHPRSLIHASYGGLLGCTFFLVLSSYAQRFPLLNSAYFSISCFLLLVIAPWVYIVWTYFRSLREVVVNPEGFWFKTRLKTVGLNWQQVNKVYLVHSENHKTPFLQIFILPEAEHNDILSLDLSRETTSVRARSCLLDELRMFFKEPHYLAYKELDLKGRNVISF